MIYSRARDAALRDTGVRSLDDRHPGYVRPRANPSASPAADPPHTRPGLRPYRQRSPRGGQEAAGLKGTPVMGWNEDANAVSGPAPDNRADVSDAGSSHNRAPIEKTLYEDNGSQPNRQEADEPPYSDNPTHGTAAPTVPSEDTGPGDMADQDIAITVNRNPSPSLVGQEENHDDVSPRLQSVSAEGQLRAISKALLDAAAKAGPGAVEFALNEVFRTGARGGRERPRQGRLLASRRQA